MAIIEAGVTYLINPKRTPRFGSDAARVRDHLAMALTIVGDDLADDELDDLEHHLAAIEHAWPRRFVCTAEEAIHLATRAIDDLELRFQPRTLAAAFDAAQHLADLTGLDLTVHARQHTYRTRLT